MASSADSSEEEEKQQCCIPEAADRPLRHPLACSDSIGLVCSDHCALRMLAPSGRHYRGEVCSKVDISSPLSGAAGAPLLPIRRFRFVWAVACLTQLATVHYSFSTGGHLETQFIYSAEDRYKSSFEISPTQLVESISTPAERSKEELKGTLYDSDSKGSRVPNHELVSEPLEDSPSSRILQVKTILEINGAKYCCILTSECQKNVKALEWRSCSLKIISVHCKGEICLWSAPYADYNSSLNPKALNNMEEPYDDSGTAIQHNRNGRRFGFSLPNTDNRIWAGIEELGLTNTDNLLDIEGEWYFLRDGGNSLEPCLLHGNLKRSRKRMFKPYDRSIGTYMSAYELHSILSSWGPLVVIEKNGRLYIHNIQSLHLRKIWEPILQVHSVTACSLDYDQIVMTGVKRRLTMNKSTVDECFWICERSLGLDHQWSVTGFEYKDAVISLLSAGGHIYWISDEYELYSVDKDENEELVIQSNDLGDEMTALARQMSLLWADGNLLLVELKQVPVVWQVTWDGDGSACYHQLNHLMGHNAFVVPGLSGFILPAADGTMGNKVYVGNGASTDCYAYSLTEKVFENLMPCESCNDHSACNARWVSLRGAVLEDDYV